MGIFHFIALSAYTEWRDTKSSLQEVVARNRRDILWALPGVPLALCHGLDLLWILKLHNS